MDYPIFIDLHRFALFWTGVITWMILTVPAGMYRKVHPARVFFHENAVVARTGQTIMCERTNDLAAAAAGAKRILRR